jgi:hypothetical protein
MNRVLLSASMALAITAAAQAQCYEGNLGTLLGTGDDTLLAVQPMNITFPMGASTYTSLQCNTNGVIYLTNGTTAAVGTSSTGYSAAAATMVTNLRGAAGGSPRIAAYWRDLNMLAANNGGVYLNNTSPGKCVVTWKNAVHYGQTSPIFTVQAQIWADGHVDMFYSATANNTAACPIVGISAGNAIADPLASNLVTGATSTSLIMYQTFATLNTFGGFQNKTISFFPNASGGYTEVMNACVPASNTNYGNGCTFKSATIYEAFPANTVDLSSTSFMMIPNGSGYTIAPGSGAPRYTHTVASLGLSDDSVATFALPSPLTYPGGSTSALDICSNGYIWMQSPNTLADFSPTAAELFSNPARLCVMWCDGLPDAVNNVYAEAVGSMVYITYNNVPIYGGVGGNMDLQVQINLASGIIEVQYGAISCGNASLVGWTVGTAGPSVVDIGSRDLSAGIAGTFNTQFPEQRGVSLSAAPAPVLGSTLVWTADNIPATAIISGQIISFVGLNPGLPLGGFGAPTCSQYVDPNAGVSSLLFGGPTVTSSLAIPNSSSYAGITLYSQVVSLDATANAFGAVFSNGVSSFLQGF